MEKRTIAAKKVLKYSMQTTLAKITTDPGEIPIDIVRKAEELGIDTDEPQIWQYTGVDGKPDTKFQLDICLPVKEIKKDAGKFSFDTLPEVTCISEIHKGSYSTLGDTYNRLFGEMSRKGIIPKMVGREVYINCDFENEENNITELQVIINS